MGCASKTLTRTRTTAGFAINFIINSPYPVKSSHARFLKGLELSISYERFLGARLNQLLRTVMVPWTNPPRRIIANQLGVG
jgi:hypothetical protein